MARKTYTRTAPAPFVMLWILRMLVSMDGMRKFASQHGFSCDRLAKALGLGHWSLVIGHWIDPEDRDFDPKAVRIELRQLLAQAEQQHTREPLPAHLVRNMQRLEQLVGLNTCDTNILTFAVCLHADPLLDAAANTLESLTSNKVHQALALLLDMPETEVRHALRSQGLLARSGLVTMDHIGTNSLFHKLDLLSHVFADQMVSSDIDPVHLLRGTIQPATKGTLSLTDYKHIQPTLDIVRPWLRYTRDTQRRGVNIFVHGAPGTGKTELARALGADVGCNLFEVASEDEDGDPVDGRHRLRAFQAAQSFLSQSRALLVFDEAEDVFNDSPRHRKATAQSHKAWINRILEDNPVPTLWLSNCVNGIDAAFIRRFDMVFELPVPPKGQRARIVQTHCGDLLDAPRLARLTEAEYLTPAVIARASAVAHGIQNEVGRESSANAFEYLIDHTLQAQGHRPLLRHDPNRLTDVYDPAFIHADTDLVQVARGLAAARTTGQSCGARLCLYGPPGTGKTAFGRWLAEQLEMPLLVRRASDLLSMWVGEAEKNIARAFREAEDEGALLLIDEVDSFLQDRQGAQRSWEVTQVNEMLTQMEAFPGVFIASTNLMNGLDLAALRRFDLKVKLDYLRAEQAWELLLRHCAQLQLPKPGPLLHPRMARLHQLTPGDFAAVLRQQRFRPVPSADDLVTALEAECALNHGAKGAIGFF